MDTNALVCFYFEVVLSSVSQHNSCFDSSSRVLVLYIYVAIPNCWYQHLQHAVVLK